MGAVVFERSIVPELREGRLPKPNSNVKVFSDALVEGEREPSDNTTFDISTPTVVERPLPLSSEDDRVKRSHPCAKSTVFTLTQLDCLQERDPRRQAPVWSLLSQGVVKGS